MLRMIKSYTYIHTYILTCIHTCIHTHTTFLRGMLLGGGSSDGRSVGFRGSGRNCFQAGLGVLRLSDSQVYYQGMCVY